MKVLGWVLVAVVMLAALASLDPALIGLSMTAPVAHLIALRGALALGAVAMAVLWGVAAFLARRTRGRARRTLALAVVALIVGIGHAGLLVERGVGQPQELPAAKPDDAIDVLTFNTHGLATSEEEIAALVQRTGADVVALQEIRPQDAEGVAAALGDDFALFTDTTGTSPAQGSALLVATDLGEFEQVDAPATKFGAVRVVAAGGEGPELLSVHAVPPVPGQMDQWRAELQTLTDLCGRVPGLVLAGDLNATVDHAALRDSGCDVCATEVGGVGTWPAWVPALLGAPIDHVLVDPQGWDAIAGAVTTAGGSDHRVVLVRLVPLSVTS